MNDTLAGVPELSALRYAQLTIGDGFGPFTEPLAQSTSDALRGALGASVPGRLAPPGVLPLLTLRLLRRALHGIIPGGVLVRQRFVAHADLPAQGDIVAEVRVASQTRGAGGLFTGFTFTLRHGDALAAVVEWTILDPEPR